MRNKFIIHANKMNALTTFLNNPQIEISTLCDQPNITSYFFKTKKKGFHHFWNLSIGITWIFFRMSLFWIDVKMISVSGIILKFQEFCMKTTLCQTYLHITLSSNLIWILASMIKRRGNLAKHIGLVPWFPGIWWSFRWRFVGKKVCSYPSRGQYHEVWLE